MALPGPRHKLVKALHGHTSPSTDTLKRHSSNSELDEFEFLEDVKIEGELRKGGFGTTEMYM
jgi:hypothetical protein